MAPAWHCMHRPQPPPEREFWFVHWGFFCFRVLLHGSQAAGFVFRHMDFISLLHQTLALLCCFSPDPGSLFLSSILPSLRFSFLFLFELSVSYYIQILTIESWAKINPCLVACVHLNDKLLGPVAAWLLFALYLYRRLHMGPWLIPKILSCITLQRMFHSYAVQKGVTVKNYVYNMAPCSKSSFHVVALR